MIAATIIMVAGVLLVALLSQRAGYRLGGVMVLPLLAIYTFREPLSPVIFVAGTAAAWGALWATREYTLNHGRRLFLIAVGVGALVTIAVGYALSQLLPARLPFENAEMIASIFPGVAAYNLMRLDPEDRPRDLLGMVVGYAALLAVGAVSLWLVEQTAWPTPPVLALPTSDLVFWLGFEPHGQGMPRLTPQWLTVSLLVVDVVAYEVVRKRYDHRLAGIIAIPLLAVFSVRYGNAPLVYVLGATAVFFALSFVHWVTLLYGRVLLGIALVAGSVYALLIGTLAPPATPGITLFFIGLFTGIGAYNLHRVAPRDRTAHIRISAAMFVAFYTVLLLIVDVPASGLIDSVSPVYALLGGSVLALGAVELYRLEQSIPDAGAFARHSVFASVSVDGADAADSPLVDGREEDR